MEWLAFDDLFVLGLALEVVAAWLLGRGLLGSAEAIALRNDKHGASNNPVDVQRAVDEVADKIDGAMGFGLLALGFTVQAFAYVLQLAQPVSPETGSGQATVAVLIFVVVILLALAVRQFARPKLLRRYLARVAVEVQTAYSRKGWSDPGVLFLVDAAHTRQVNQPPNDPHADDSDAWLESVFPVAIRTDQHGFKLVSLR